MSTDSVTDFDAAYCVIDTHNLFVCATLEDELLVLGADHETHSRIAAEAVPFGLTLDPGRRLDSYSGGEQVILCALMLLHLLPVPPSRILFVHALEALSSRNRTTLLDLFRSRLPSFALCTLTDGCPEAIYA